MKRRAFLTISATSLAGLAFGNRLSSFSESNLEKKVFDRIVRRYTL